MKNILIRIIHIITFIAMPAIAGFCIAKLAILISANL